MKISFVIITKNEEKNIERCLLSILPVADEIIVIDSFSTDETPNICKKHKVRFEQCEWQGYARTKNFGNSLAQHPFIFSIDADEALSDHLQFEIARLKKSNTNAEAYLLNRQTNYCGKWIKHCGWYPDWKIRLWKKELGSWEGSIHEQLILKDEVKTGKLNSNLLHYSYYSRHDHLKQIWRFTDLMAEENLAKKKKVSNIKLFISPVYKFINVYFIRLGFLDGRAGFIISSLSSYATYLKNKKTRALFAQNSN